MSKYPKSQLTPRFFSSPASDSAPLKSGPTAAPLYLRPRFEVDPGVTPDALRLRSMALDLLPEIGQLETPSLVSTAHGDMRRLLFTIPGWLFLPASEDPVIPIMLGAITDLWSKLPATTKLLILTHEATVADLDATIASLGLSARTEVVPAPNSVRFTVWAEDAYSIANDATDNETYFVEPASFRRADDAYIADLVAHVTDLERTQVRLYFQGGNILICDDFWMIGADYPNNSLQLGFVVPQPNETPLEAIRRAYGQAMDHNRHLLPIGSRLPVPSSSVREFQLNGQTWKEYLYRGNNPGTVQPMFHIDMFITPVGRNAAGKYQVMVGDPRMAAETLGQELKPEAMAEIYDDIADQFAALDFAVVRNPLPLTYDDNEDTKEREWYFATANNALVMHSHGTKKVWLPTYGHRKWPELAATDAQNKAIWEGLGFEVEMLGDFHPFAINLGAVHCIKKYLMR